MSELLKNTTEPSCVGIEVIEFVGAPGAHVEILVEEAFDTRCRLAHDAIAAHAVIKYVPADTLVELMSLRSYLRTFAKMEVIAEELAYQIYADIRDALKPRTLTVTVTAHAASHGPVTVTLATRNGSE